MPLCGTEAANVLQELQVETYGSMDRREKVIFILEQMRLTLSKKVLTCLAHRGWGGGGWPAARLIRWHASSGAHLGFCPRSHHQQEN